MALVIPGKNHPSAPVLPAEAVVLGEALVDLFPEPPGTPLDEAERFQRHLGGAGANLAIDLARLGVRSALVTLVGGDAFGRFLRRRLDEEGVATDGVGQHRSARTGVCFAALGARGERTFLGYRQPSADQLLTPADFQPAHVSRGRLLCLGSSTLLFGPSRAAMERAAEIGRGAHQLLFCDLNFRPHQWGDAREGAAHARRLLQLCDVVKLSEGELLPLFGTDEVEAAARRARQLGPAVVVVTRGAQGCYLDCHAGQCHLAGEVPRAPVVDPVGAGDAFSAGLLAELLAALGPRGAGDARERLRALGLGVLKAACVRGNRLGALCCTQVGATSAVRR